MTGDLKGEAAGADCAPGARTRGMTAVTVPESYNQACMNALLSLQSLDVLEGAVAVSSRRRWSCKMLRSDLLD